MRPVLKRNFEVFSACDWLAALTAHIPKAGEHLLRDCGWYSNVNRGKRRKAQGEEPRSIEEYGEVSASAAKQAWARRSAELATKPHQAGLRGGPPGLLALWRKHAHPRVHRAAPDRREDSDPSRSLACLSSQSAHGGVPVAVLAATGRRRITNAIPFRGTAARLGSPVSTIRLDTHQRCVRYSASIRTTRAGRPGSPRVRHPARRRRGRGPAKARS